MRSMLFVLAAAFFPGAAFADDWLFLASSDKGVWEGRKGTRVFGTTKGGIPIAVADGRVRWTQDKSIDFVRWYVSVQDCKQGYGKLVTLTMSGEFKYENDYVKNGGNVASALGEMLCYDVEQQKLKGV